LSKYTADDCVAETRLHQFNVRRFMYVIIDLLTDRLINHDKSKLVNPELDVFVEFTPKLKESTYGSDEYKEFLKGMQLALKHHYENNRHHPEHFENGIRGMNLVDIVEMFCDWKAATLRHNDGDISKSIEINKKRFNYSDDLEQIFKNTIELLNELDGKSIGKVVFDDILKDD